MNCRGVSRRLSAYIDNDLSPGIKQAMDEHLQTCIGCKRRLSEYEAVIEAAHVIKPLTISDGFSQKVTEAIRSRQPIREVQGVVHYRFTLAGVAFVTAAAAIFFLVGPPATENLNPTFSGTEDRSVSETPGVTDFYEHPETKVSSFPIPEGSEAARFSANDSLLRNDSTSRVDEFILPSVQEVRENVNVKF